MARQMQKKQGFLARLARNQAGNVIAMYAAALIPLLGMLGGGIDMSRMYLTKTRLQQACDAGALAGRKQMAGGAWSDSSYKARTVAVNLFNANFQTGSYGTTGGTPTYTESAGKVTGTATAQVPMTIMKIFGQPTKSITVSCEAQMAIPNTDVMFVLDNTGSMDDTNSGDTVKKIDGLKTAVRCFYETLAKIDTVANCGSTPSGGTTNVQLRFGFVPYSTNVNVGSLLPDGWLADSWSYQTRVANTALVHTWAAGTESAISGWGSWSATPTGYDVASNFSGWNIIPTSSVTINGTNYSRNGSNSNSTNCNAPNSNNGAVGYVDTGNIQNPALQSTTPATPTYPTASQTKTYNQSDNHTVIAYKYVYNSSVSPKTCYLYYATRSYTLTRSGGESTTPITWTDYNQLQSWTYKQASLNIANLKSHRSYVTLPIGSSSVSVKLSGSNSSTNINVVANVDVPWDGCIEERPTVSQSSYSPIPSGAYDMNIDLVPSSGTSYSLWAPALEEAVWGRYTGSSTNTTSEVTTSSNLWHNISAYCPAAARKLQIYTSSTDFDNYVSTMTPTGNTYHDIGLVWGARLISPTGLFASENALTPNGGEIQRHIIFMTDGDACTGTENYTAYGAQWWDRRTTGSSSAPTDGCTSTGTLTQQVNARTDALCTAIKNMDITLWVISYGGGISSSVETRLQNCASPGRYYSASNTSTLLSQFQGIANQISALRLTQ